MPTSHSTSQYQVVNQLPVEIQAVLAAYADAVNISTQEVVEIIVASFLETDTDSQQVEVSETNSTLPADLPPAMQIRIQQYAQFYEVPPEFVLELAISHFLDPDSVTFDDCQVTIQREQTEWLQHQWSVQADAA